MVQASIRICVPPGKLTEVLQTFKAMLDPIRHQPGCISCSCYIDAESENNICLIEEWQSGGDLNLHLKSVYFSILDGAMKLLVEPPDMRFHTIASTASAETIRVARTHECHGLKITLTQEEV